jgi:hypothetical protein
VDSFVSLSFEVSSKALVGFNGSLSGIVRVLSSKFVRLLGFLVGLSSTLQVTLHKSGMALSGRVVFYSLLMNEVGSVESIFSLLRKFTLSIFSISLSLLSSNDFAFVLMMVVSLAILHLSPVVVSSNSDFMHSGSVSVSLIKNLLFVGHDLSLSIAERNGLIKRSLSTSLFVS